MSLQRLGGFDLAATTETMIYECPDEHHATVSINLVARSGAPTVRLALTASAAPAATDWLEYDLPLVAGGAPLLREGIAMFDGNRLYAYASATGVSVVAWGNAERVRRTT